MTPKKFIPGADLVKIRALISEKEAIHEKIAADQNRLLELTDVKIAEQFGLNWWNITALRHGKSYTKNKVY